MTSVFAICTAHCNKMNNDSPNALLYFTYILNLGKAMVCWLKEETFWKQM